MYKIKKVNILSLALTVTLIYFILGIILGIVLSIVKAVSKTNPGIAALGQGALNDLLNLAYWQIILVYPVSYAIGGFVVSIIVGLVYNLVAKSTGGVAVSLVKADSRESKEFGESKKIKK